MGGELDYTSNGNGTCFTFDIPLVRAAGVSNEQSKDFAGNNKKMAFRAMYKYTAV